MNKKYLQPAMQALAAQPVTVLALSILDGKASSGTDVLVKENPWELDADEDKEGVFE